MCRPCIENQAAQGIWWACPSPLLSACLTLGDTRLDTLIPQDCQQLGHLHLMIVLVAGFEALQLRR